MSPMGHSRNFGRSGPCPLLPGEFNRSTQHYPLERSGRGAAAISPLRVKILDAALVPRSAQAKLALIGRSFSALRALPSAAARTMSVHVPSHACLSNVPERSGRVLRRPVESTPQKRPDSDSPAVSRLYLEERPLISCYAAISSLIRPQFLRPSRPVSL